jgi:hypothetical protein
VRDDFGHQLAQIAVRFVDHLLAQRAVARSQDFGVSSPFGGESAA